MHGASRESAIAAQERLDAVVASADSAALSADFRAVAGLLDREPSLRRALADPTRPSADRSELLANLLGGKVSAESQQVLEVLVGGRWSGAADLVDAVELLAVQAELSVAEKAGALADVEDELFRFSRVVSGDPRLAGVLSDTTAAADHKASLVGDLLGGKATESTVRLVEMAVNGLGGRGFDASLQKLIELTAERRDRQVAYVQVAAPMTDEQEQRLSTRLSGIYGRDMSLKVTVDPTIIGGATVRVGDDLYDGSVARRLDQARTALGK
jgi:F-type H+-transporting ATPase subunit delta